MWMWTPGETGSIQQCLGLRGREGSPGCKPSGGWISAVQEDALCGQ